MDYNKYQRPLQMPAGYAVLSEEEMTYTEGGFSFTVGKYEVTVDTDVLAQVAIANVFTVTTNLVMLIARSSFDYTVNGLRNGWADGLEVDGIISHYWGKQNSWGKVASVGMVALGGFYAYLQARSLFNSLKGIYDSFMDTYNQYKADQQAAAQIA